MSVFTSHNPPQPDGRRERGSYYTPGFIVRHMLQGCLAPFLRGRTPFQQSPVRLLDPACGNGAFILEAFDMLHDWYRDFYRNHRGERADRMVASPDGWQLTSGERLRIVREHLYGVDVDADAVGALQSRLHERVAPERSLAESAWDVIRSNIRIGDALTGPDFRIPERRLFDIPEDQTGDSKPLDFRRCFPKVASVGGFDVVIGNPPYRRELNAKPMFDRLARSPLGRTWRQARMDLWYYFLHRGLDLLRPHGRLSFIVNGYWTASSGARKLIARLERETTFEEVVLLGEAAVFRDVAGRHLIFRLRPGRENQSCHAIDMSRSCAHTEELLGRLTSATNPSGLPWHAAASCDLPGVESYEVPREDLFRHGQLSLGRPDPFVSSIECNQTLGDLYEVRQGMAENPPSVNARLNREFGDRYRVGEGVFVLTAEEIETLGFSATEREFLRPYYQTASLTRYGPPGEPSRFVLYLTRNTAPSLALFPRLREHLDRFRPILERRRETRKGVVQWWQLHWPREERIFVEPRILSVQMGRQPQFLFAERPTFVGFSVNVILSGSPDGFALTTLTGLLNSSLVRRWFSQYAKRRGVNLEINGKLLRRFPLPRRDIATEQQLHRLVTQRQSLQRSAEDDAVRPEMVRLEQAIDELVCGLYGVSSRQRATGTRHSFHST